MTGGYSSRPTQPWKDVEKWKWEWLEKHCRQQGRGEARINRALCRGVEGLSQ